MVRRWLTPIALAFALVAAGCSSGDDGAASNASADAQSTGGIRVVTPEEGAALAATESDDVIVLDVRTPEEFDEGHLDGAIMIDFYDDDFADQLAGLDRDATYVLYCRSGNRSGQTTSIMRDLGFTDVADVDGGIIAWQDAGLPIAR